MKAVTPVFLAVAVVITLSQCATVKHASPRRHAPNQPDTEASPPAWTEGDLGVLGSHAVVHLATTFVEVVRVDSSPDDAAEPYTLELTPAQLATYLKQLHKKTGTYLMSLPTVTTIDGLRGSVESVSGNPVAARLVGGSRGPTGSVPSSSASRITVHHLPRVSPDGRSLSLRTFARVGDIDSLNPIDAPVTVADGNSIVFRGNVFQTDELGYEKQFLGTTFKRGTKKLVRETILIVTANIIDASGDPR